MTVAFLGRTMSSEIERVAHLMCTARHAVALTGAGLSTESGIPDFRSPGGVWERFRPIEYQEFLASHGARIEHWCYKQATVPVMLQAEPNAGHRALAALEAAGRLAAVITQNIDALHQRAGSRRVLELHGTNLEAVCLDCGARVPIAAALEQLEHGEAVPRCIHCGGWLKPATVSFGQALPADVLQSALALAEESDCFLALGSSLLVNPAASLAGVAKRSGGGADRHHPGRHALRRRCRRRHPRPARGSLAAHRGARARPDVMDLFAYGTLMDGSVFSRVAGTVRPAAPASADGWVRRRVRGEVYPAIVPEPGGVVDGVVYFDLPPAAWACLDAFEGEMYERTRLGVRGDDGREWEAFSYVAKPAYRHLLGGNDWSFTEFAARDLPGFLSDFRGFSALASKTK
jgi:NAD-dependent deacetylase